MIIDWAMAQSISQLLGTTSVHQQSRERSAVVGRAPLAPCDGERGPCPPTHRVPTPPENREIPGNLIIMFKHLEISAPRIFRGIDYSPSRRCWTIFGSDMSISLQRNDFVLVHTFSGSQNFAYNLRYT